MQRRQFLATMGGAAVAPAIVRGQTRRPNLIFMLSDDMGYADLGCYGARDIRTPHLDGMAAHGVRFSDCYSNGAVCTPTRVAFLTGRYQQRFGKALEWALVPANNDVTGLHPRHSVLPSLLKPLGYRAALVGKWHVGSLPPYRPKQHGFDESFGIFRGNADMYSHQYRDDSNDLFLDDQPARREGYLTELLAERAVDFIQRQGNDPFFLYLPFNAVHWPFQEPDRPDQQRNAQTWTDGDRQIYRRMTESMDAAVGAVLDALRRKGLDDNTLAVFTNDNGGERLSDNRPFFHSKATLYEGGIRVPAIARWPGQIPAGSHTEQVAATFDFTATFLAAAGASIPTDERRPDGINLLPTLRGEAPPAERTLCWRIENSNRRQAAVRKGNWKWIREPAGNHEMLIDLSRDPGERENLSYQHPDKLAELRAIYERWHQEVNGQAKGEGEAANRSVV
ncbi:MAG: sulfatase-like hydrolase/transferase [Bryobacterales bacterium]|jgi:arylsulfatase A-like enzyme|nr:sulfatase-like hydrolase/transferase [Bryobacterales bacterium]